MQKCNVVYRIVKYEDDEKLCGKFCRKKFPNTTLQIRGNFSGTNCYYCSRKPSMIYDF